jgi:hypothetical protein
MINPSLYDAYTGRYQIGPTELVTITREGDRLMAQPTGEGKMEVFPESETIFFLKPSVDATMTFVKDKQGKVTHILLRREGRETKAKRLDDEARAGAPR